MDCARRDKLEAKELEKEIQKRVATTNYRSRPLRLNAINNP